MSIELVQTAGFDELGYGFAANAAHGLIFALQASKNWWIVGNWLTAVIAVGDAVHHSVPESLLSVVALYSAGASLTSVCGFVSARYIVNMQPITVSDGIAINNHTQGL